MGAGCRGGGRRPGPQKWARTGWGARTGCRARGPRPSPSPGGDTPWTMAPGYPGDPHAPGGSWRFCAPRFSPYLPLPDGGPSPRWPGTGRSSPFRTGGTLDLEAGFVRRTIAGQEVGDAGLQRAASGPPDPGGGREHHRGELSGTSPPFHTAVHWHGLRLENRYDGGAGGSPRIRWSRGAPSSTGSTSPTPASTGTTPTTARIVQKEWGCRGSPGGFPGSRCLRSGEPGGGPPGGRPPPGGDGAPIRSGPRRRTTPSWGASGTPSW